MTAAAYTAVHLLRPGLPTQNLPALLAQVLIVACPTAVNLRMEEGAGGAVVADGSSRQRCGSSAMPKYVHRIVSQVLPLESAATQAALQHGSLTASAQCVVAGGVAGGRKDAG